VRAFSNRLQKTVRIGGIFERAPVVLGSGLRLGFSGLRHWLSFRAAKCLGPFQPPNSASAERAGSQRPRAQNRQQVNLAGKFH
jgi:hypothetical protein